MSTKMDRNSESRYIIPWTSHLRYVDLEDFVSMVSVVNNTQYIAIINTICTYSTL